ncbi:MAG: CAP domain-containing protein, partial [Conexibacter sp.]
SHASVERGAIRRARLATLCLLNRVRSRAGLPPLRLNPKLSRVAGRHSRDMVRRGYFAHVSQNGASPFQRILRSHYVPRNHSWWLGENIGWGTSTLAQPASLVRMWMHSPPHRANILSRRFREIGIGIALGVPVRGAHTSRSGGATYTTDFGSHS